MENDERKPRFKLAVRNIGAGETEDEVRKVQQYLGRFGYLREDFEPGKLDQPTQDALKVFQRGAHINVTGLIDDPTADMMEEPRCGVPDYPRGGPFATMDDFFALSAKRCRYPTSSSPLKWAITTPPNSFAVADISPVIRAAFDTWKVHIPIAFEEVSSSAAHTLKVGWVVKNHGDDPFDGVGHILAHAFEPPKCGGTHTGNCHFDIEETWRRFHDEGVRDIQTVALHEIGHLLGLRHSDDGNSVMFKFYQGERRKLTEGDITEIKGLYAS